MNYNWNWNIFWDMEPSGAMTYLDTLVAGAKWTLAVALSAWVLALMFGALIGVLRTLQDNRLAQAIGNAWVELFRNIPLLVQMFLWFFVMPEFLPKEWGDQLKNMPNAPFITAVICLAFFTSSRVAVQITSGIQALPRGQRMAATALGMTTWQTYRHILLPMAGRIVLPPLTSEFMNIIKNSSVALTIGVIELTAASRSMSEYTFQTFEALSAATLIYVCINICIVLLMRVLERTLAVPGFIGSKTQAGGH
ncbi:amino acid ABC transporter permease [Massilia sp. W12]|uniref:amino acid ABC transporter permease n=1 Tax=Massilia sp. W12 TaxID=3126507 RepID=UPI0030CB42AA